MNSNLKYFIYCRKSSEDSHRQIASIGDQINALQRVVEREALTISQVFTEERSAKDPDRPIFNEMLKKIDKGEANALLCWDFDRLSRNPIDTGQLQWKLQKGVIKVIKTPSRTYYPDDAGLLLSIEGGRATDYVVKLSTNVKRGMDSRAMQGWRPIIAPIGYLNVGFEKGNKTIEPDPERFEIIKKMWEMLLSGGYSVSDILTTATHEWGLRSPKRRKMGGTPITKSHLYEIFRHPFYYGYFNWRDAETGEIRLLKGSHKPMISELEYWRAQKLLGRKGQPQPQTKEFAYTGMFRCGECQSSVTGEEKFQVRCTECRHKFSCISKSTCPRCNTDIADMNNPIIRTYVYFRCTKKKNARCTQKAVTLDELEKQLLQKIEHILIDEYNYQNTIQYIHEKYSNATTEKQAITNSIRSAYNDCLKRLSNLNRVFVSEQNSKHELFTEQEFLEQKISITSERDALERKLHTITVEEEDEYVNLIRFFKFCKHAKYHYQNGDLKMKRRIIRALGSNHQIIDKIANIFKHNPFITIEQMNHKQLLKYSKIEPENSMILQEPNAKYAWDSIDLCSSVEAVRTFLREHKDTFTIPDLDALSKESYSS